MCPISRITVTEIRYFGSYTCHRGN